MVQGKGGDFGVLGQDRVDGAAQIADALAVNDPHLEDAALPARRQVVRHQVLDLARTERVQVQHAVNGQLDGLVHRSPSYSLRARFVTSKGNNLLPAGRILTSGMDIKIRRLPWRICR